MVWVSHPVVLVSLQVLHARFFAVVAGVGLTVFQRVIPHPGLASGLFANTRRLGAIAFGATISLPLRLRWDTAASLPPARLSRCWCWSRSG